MPKRSRQTVISNANQTDDASCSTLPDAIAAVRRALVLRAHLAEAGADRKLRHAHAIVTNWVMRIVAAGVGTDDDIARKRDFVRSLDRYAFALDAHHQAMAEAVLAHEARIQLSRPLAH